MTSLLCRADVLYAPAPQPEKSRYLADLEFVAQAPRVVQTEHHTAVQNLCAERFEELGYEVERQDYGSGINVIGRLAGKKRPDEVVVVSAHYDSVPGCKGADDNATGVAALLETARLLASEEHDRTLVVACWDGEEEGLLGSWAYAVRAEDQNVNIVVSYVYETIGYRDKEPGSQRLPEGLDLVYPEQAEKLKENGFRGDFVALIFDGQAQRAASDIVKAVEEEDIPAIQLQVDLDGILPRDLLRSDHAAFWGRGYPAIMITDSAEFRNPNYHCRQGEDDVATLDHDFAVKIALGVLASARKALEASE